MIEIAFNTKEFDELAHKLSNAKTMIKPQRLNQIFRKALKPVENKIFQLQPKSINNSRYSYSSAQINIQKYGLLQDALGISKKRKQEPIGEYSYFVGYDQSRGLKAYVGVFLNYGTNQGNHLRRLAFLQQAEKSTWGQVMSIFTQELQKDFDKYLIEYR